MSKRPVRVVCALCASSRRTWRRWHARAAARIATAALCAAESRLSTGRLAGWRLAGSLDGWRRRRAHQPGQICQARAAPPLLYKNGECVSLSNLFSSEFAL